MFWKRAKPSPIPEKDMAEILNVLREQVSKKPPTIGLVGVSGVGKSSTINAMFKTNLPVSHTVACTKEFQAVDLCLEFANGKLSGELTALRVVDAPGLGDSVSNDSKYIADYRENLPDCDVIFWVMAARNRAVSLDQMYLERLKEHHPKIVFALNQCDLVEPLNWRETLNIPSREQESYLKEILSDRASKIREVVGENPRIVYYSAARGYNLEMLFKIFLESCPVERRWIYYSLKNFSYKDFAFKGFQKLISTQETQKR